ncbi:uncharacterized protein LOC144353311 [Saccoglossus kowalevskii]
MDTRQLFKIQNYIWTGAIVGLFEAEYNTMLNHNPIPKLDQPLLPIIPTVIYHITRPSQSLFTSTKPHSLSPKLMLSSVVEQTFVTANVNSHCPATFTQDMAKRVIQCRITSKAANILNTPLTSAFFSRLLLSEHAMKTTSTQMLEFRNYVRDILRYYADHDVTWKISGWYKPGLQANDEQVRDPKFHVTCVTPERVLENAPPTT